jgi:hypothetical protein
MMLDGMFQRARTLWKAVILTEDVSSSLKWIPGKSFDCLYWTSSASHAIINIQFRTDVDAVIVAKPSDVQETDFPAKSRLALYKEAVSISAKVNNGGGYAPGSTSMAVKDLAASFKHWSVLKVGTDETIYYIQSLTKDSSGNITGVNFYPGLSEAAIDDEDIKIYPADQFIVINPSDIMGRGEVMQVTLKSSDK